MYTRCTQWSCHLSSGDSSKLFSPIQPLYFLKGQPIWPPATEDLMFAVYFLFMYFFPVVHLDSSCSNIVTVFSAPQLLKYF